MTEETVTVDLKTLAQRDQEIDRALANRRLDFYTPYPKQLEFHNAGGMHGVVERLLMAGNQVGKTMSAAAECAYHATGLYPKWWRGARFEKAISAWVAGSTSQSTRDNPQRLLVGSVGEWGKGMIPSGSILEYKRAVHGVADALETILVRHHPTGGVSRITFKSYDQLRERWQGETLDFVWYDEEPPMDIYSEGKTRVQAAHVKQDGRPGFVFITFTPLLGATEVVRRFIIERAVGTHITEMTIYDALHYTTEQRAAIIAAYPEHERRARSEGVPIMGSGLVFPVDEMLIKEAPLQIPAFWSRICGLDIGWAHPTAAVWVAHDRDLDCVHVYDAHRVKEQTPIFHAATIKAKGAWIPVSWPHDALSHDKGSGAQIAKQYRDLGVNMLKDKATHAPVIGKPEGSGGFGVEAGIMEMLDRMNTGRFKVFETLSEWFEEFRMYHRKDGIIVKEGDDLLSATRIAIMMLRKARVFQKMGGPPVLPHFINSDPSMGVLG